MPLKLAIIGLDPLQQDWIAAIRALAAEDAVLPVAAGHRSAALARDLSQALGDNVPAYDDLRKLLLDSAPQLILLDRPENATADFLAACLEQKISIFSLGPPVGTLAEARALAERLEPRTAQLFIWPRLAETRAYRHCASADQFVRPVRFFHADWCALNHALAKTTGQSTGTVRSLTVLAWDALSTLIDLVGLPESIYAAFRGTGGQSDQFADLSGAMALTLRLADQGIGSLTLSDRIGPPQRQMLLSGQGGTLRLDEHQYHFADAEGKLIDEGHVSDVPQGTARVLEDFRAFLEQVNAPSSPHRGWPHRLEQVAAAMEAMLVSHRTGQAESPDKFLNLRR